eukprot:COSAG02_NODE_123_length_35269_cov_51.697526_2_plen_146_part_00
MPRWCVHTVDVAIERGVVVRCLRAGIIWMGREGWEGPVPTWPQAEMICRECWPASIRCLSVRCARRMGNIADAALAIHLVWGRARVKCAVGAECADGLGRRCIQADGKLCVQVSRGHALAMNIASAKGLQDVVKSNLGPKGTLKM